MAYSVDYRKSAIEFKEDGHTFARLKKVFKITAKTYYEWVNLFESTGSLQFRNASVRQGKIDLEKLKHAVAEKPGAYLRELAAQFDVSTTAIHNRLEKHNVTYKKKTFAYSERNEEDRAEYGKKLENIPIEKRVYVDERGVNQCLVRESEGALCAA